MSENVWIAIISALAGSIGGGGLVKIWDRWLSSRKDGHTFLFEQYQALIDDDRKTIASLRGKVTRLEDSLSEKVAALTEAIVENIRIKAENRSLTSRHREEDTECPPAAEETTESS